MSSYINEEKAFKNIKVYLESKGTIFGEYYGAIIHISGPKPENFFSRLNEGSFTLDVLKIPNKCRKVTVKVDVNKLDEMLNEI